MIKCPACGTDNGDGSNFCIACGIDLTSAATEQRVRTDSVGGPTPAGTSSSVDMPREYLETPPPPAPPPAPTPFPNYTPPTTPPPAYASSSSAPQTKDRTLPIIIELIAGFFGFLGVGWMVAGNVTTGLWWLIGFWVGNIIAVVLDVVTFGFFTCVHVPLVIAAVPFSAYMLYRYTKEHPEVFGP